MSFYFAPLVVSDSEQSIFRLAHPFEVFVHHLTSPDGLEQQHSGLIIVRSSSSFVWTADPSGWLTCLQTRARVGEKESLCKNNHDENFSRLKKLAWFATSQNLMYVVVCTVALACHATTSTNTGRGAHNRSKVYIWLYTK